MKRIREIPEHLLPFVVEQKPELYTAIDHEAWRYIMRIGCAFFEKNAHQKYLDGLKETGISLDRIPLISEMDHKLSQFGWRAVAVSGFIPPAVFLEFQSLGILAIACDMRSLEHLAYTPAPDIVHEAAGHAPIIADPAYRKYLLAYGEVARRAIFSKEDLDGYEAVRSLSDIKEDPASSQEQIQAAEQRLTQVTADNKYISEANQLTRMAWWTVEYGLVGDYSNPKIYGAGLLSSVGESYSCLEEPIKKIPFSIDCINVSYDITRPQPQLFIAPNFKVLETVLKTYQSTMAFMRGGVEGLAKAKMARTLTTTEFDSGIQVSGILKTFIVNQTNQPIYLQYESPVQLSFRDHQLTGHGTEHHSTGFSTPIGKVKVGTKLKCPSMLTESDLRKLGFDKGKRGKLKFESKIELSGILVNKISKSEKFIVLSFSNCTIRFGNQTLYKPEWGVFDLACGCEIKSVFGGAADRTALVRSQKHLIAKAPFQKTNLTQKNKRQTELYASVRELRTKKLIRETEISILTEVFRSTLVNYPDDWLLPMIILELISNQKNAIPLLSEIKQYLKTHQIRHPHTKTLIERGLSLL